MSTPPDWPAPRVCHEYPFTCPLEEDCDETNHCLVSLLRERGWTVIAPVPGSWPPKPFPIEVGYIARLNVPLGEPEPPPWPDWQTCDGRALRAADYPELADRLKQHYGTGEEPDTFRLPDMRPYLMRIRTRP